MSFSSSGRLLQKSSLFAAAAIAALGSSLAVSPAFANESDESLKTFGSLLVELEEQENIGQVTSVSQLSDVFPTDWAFQAVQSLVERYGCVAGYPDGTYRGQRAMTRYEAAALLNACLDNVSDRFASKEELAQVQALQEEFKAELATLRGRVDGLEARTDTLEAQQFSTTTQLKGEVVFSTGYVADEDDPLDSALGVDTDGGNTASDRVFFGHRARLNFETSFNGKDLLRTRLQSLNIPVLTGGGSAGVESARLSIDGGQGNNDISLDELFYRFKPIDKLTTKVTVVGGDYKDDVETFNTNLKSSGSGALARFFRFNPAVFRAPGNTTISGIYEVNNDVELAVMLAADDAESPVSDAANFNRGGICCGGQWGGLAQIGFTPVNNVRVGLTYTHNEYRGNGPDITGGVADAPVTVGIPGLAGIFASEDTSEPFGDDFNTITNNFGLNIDAKVSDRFHFSAWTGLTLASSEGARDAARLITGGTENSEVKLINWAANFIFPDLIAEGNRGSLSVGMPPFIFDSGDLGIDDGNNPTIMAEAQYQFKVSKFIKISPGVIAIFRANNTESNDPIVVPIVRTTFKF